MELITLTSEIREKFGIKTAHLSFGDKDLIVMLKQLSMENVIFTCSNFGIQYDMPLVLVFPTSEGEIVMNITVDVYYEDEGAVTVEATIQATNKNDFFILFEKFIKELIMQKKRKERRIICTRQNLELLNLINVFNFEFRYRQFRAVIKDISYTGLRILCNPILLQENGNLFNFKLVFEKPDETFLFFKCPVIRKELYSFEGHDFAQIVFKIEPSLRFKERISDYLQKEDELEKKRLVKR